MKIAFAQAVVLVEKCSSCQGRGPGWPQLGQLAIGALLMLAIADRAALGQLRTMSSGRRGVSSLPRAPVGGWGSVRYGGRAGDLHIRAASRSLPSEARYNARISGMMRSEIRGAALAEGGNLFKGAAARVTMRAPGTIRHSREYGAVYGASPSVKQLYKPRRPRAGGMPVERFDKPMASTSFGRGSGTIRHPNLLMTQRPLTTGYRVAPATLLRAGPQSRSSLQTSRFRPSGSIRNSGTPQGRQIPVGLEPFGAKETKAADSPARFRAPKRVAFASNLAGIRGSHRSAMITELPGGHSQFRIEGHTYYRAGWTFYEQRKYAGHDVYAETPAPYGTVIADLPPNHESLVVDGRTYYFGSDTYFVSEERDGRSQYVVAERPTIVSAPIPMQLLRQMSDCLAGMQQFDVDTTDSVEQVSDSGQKKKFVTHRKLSVRRPNTMRIDSRGEHIDRSTWYDGRSIVIWERKEHEYAVHDLPGTIDKMLDELAEQFTVHVPLADLLYSDVYKALITDTGTNVARYVSRAKLGDVECHQLAFESSTTTWNIWIEVGDRPLPQKLQISYNGDPKRPDYIVTLRDWDLSPKFPQGRFVFSPPPGAKKVQLLPKLYGG